MVRYFHHFLFFHSMKVRGSFGRTHILFSQFLLIFKGEQYSSRFQNISKKKRPHQLFLPLIKQLYFCNPSFHNKYQKISSVEEGEKKNNLSAKIKKGKGHWNKTRKVKKDQKIENGPGKWERTRKLKMTRKLKLLQKKDKVEKRKINWFGSPKIKRMPKLAYLVSPSEI